MVELIRNYIEDHMVALHTQNSWARQVCSDVLNAVIQQLGDKSALDLAVEGKFTVSPVVPPEGVERSTCIRVCASIGSGPQRCVHLQAPI